MRRIFVRAKPGAKRDGVETIDKTHYVVAVREPAREGKANRAIEAALAAYFGIPRAMVEIVSGHHGRIKVIEIVG